MKSRQANYLDKKDIMKIKLCCILPHLVAPAFFCGLLVTGEWLALTTIDEVGFDGTTAGVETLPLLLIIAAISSIFFSVACLYPFFTIRGNKWKELCERIDMHEQGLITTVPAERSKSSTFIRHPYEVADACNITIPSIKKQRWAICLVPMAIMLAVFVPKILESNEAKQQKNELAAQTIHQLESTFAQDGVQCTGYGVGEAMQNKYDFTVRRNEDPQEHYFNLTFNVESEIYELNFCMYPDETKTAQENLDDFLEYVQENVQILKKSGVKVNIPDWERHTQPLLQLTGKYLESEGKKDYLESVKEGDVKVLFSNRCKDVTPQNPAYLYFLVKDCAAE